MPYLKPAVRTEIDVLLKELTTAIGVNGSSPGELNYIFTRLAQAYVHGSGLNYTTLNAVVGAFESAKLEFYRRKVAPYEDKKIAENGDVY